MSGFTIGGGLRPVDAVVHFAAIPRNLYKHDGETFRTNIMGTYHVIEAAIQLGTRRIRVERNDPRRVLRKAHPCCSATGLSLTFDAHGWRRL